jgi:glycosyltransferase involved in cell wall biosynthesis
VVVPTYNRAADVEQLLACLSRQELKPDVSWEVIVVDNASTDGTQATLERWRGRLPLRIEREPKRGSSAARNRGTRVARGRLIAYADSDVLVGPAWLQSFVTAAEEYPDVAFFSGLHLQRYEVSPPSWYVGVGQGTLGAASIGAPPTMATSVWGGNWACRIEALESVGGFDTRLGPKDLPAKDWRIVGNEGELFDRLSAAGFKGLLLRAESSAGHHKVPPDETRLAYVLRWYFGLGRGEALRAVEPCARMLTVPRWRIRLGFGEVGHFVVAGLRGNRREAIRMLMRVSATVGFIYESMLRTQVPLAEDGALRGEDVERR